MKKQYKYTVVTFGLTLTSIMSHTLHSIIGFIAIYFFKPIWDSIIKWWNHER